MADSDAELSKKALHEHHVLQELLGSLMRFISLESDFTVEDQEKLHGDLKCLRGHLKSHFSLEEEGRLFESILARMPMVESTLDTLRAEHAEFLTTLDGFVKRLESERFPDMPALCAELCTLVQKLKDHERIENDLFQRTYNLDIGTAD